MKPQRKITIYGIKHCNSMKKAFDLLNQYQIDYEFVDYKKVAPSIDFLHSLIRHESIKEKGGLSFLINTKGTTYKKIKNTYKNIQSSSDFDIDMIARYPSMIKRPLVVVQTFVDDNLGIDSMDNLIASQSCEILVGLEQLRKLLGE